MAYQRQLNQRVSEEIKRLLEDIQEHYSDMEMQEVTQKYTLVACIKGTHRRLFPHMWKGNTFLPEKRQTA